MVGLSFQMASRESINKVNKQQEACQSTLAISKAGLKSTPKASSYSTLANVKSSVPTVKFSSNTARLQDINKIRKSAAGLQLKLVIDLLRETRQALTAEQINEACYVDVNANKDVFDSLRKNIKVYYDGRRYSYKSTHELKDKEELLVLIRKLPEGIAVTDLKDAYPTVMDDLQALKAACEVWLLSDSKEEIAYPNDPKARIMIDDDLKKLFREIELPNDMIDIEKDLRKNGMKPATNTAKRRAAQGINAVKPKEKKKPREISKRTKLTNTHIPELFKNLES